MHVAIELNELRLTHYHTDTRVVSGLTYLESLHLKNVLLDDTNSETFLSNLTPTMLRQLYHNTTLKELPEGMDELEMRDVLATLFDRLTPPKVDHDELLAQIDHVLYQLEADEKEGKQFKYVYGAQVPAILDGGLFPVTTPPASESVLANSAQLAHTRRKAPAAATIPSAPDKPQRVRATGPATPKGLVGPTIWAHADAAWEAAGKPTDKETVLALRKVWYEELEAKGILRSTASNTLAGWQKARIG